MQDVKRSKKQTQNFEQYISLEKLEPRVMLSATPGAESVEHFRSATESLIPISDPVDIPDSGLKTALQAAVDAQVGPGEPLTEANLALLTTLDASTKIITDLTGLEYCVNLTNLDLSGNFSLSNISQLASLTKLTDLNLYYNSITDISALTSLTTLENLNLSSNSNLSNLDPLFDLSNMKVLNLANCNVNDVTYLQNMTKLTTLDLKNNDVGSISDLDALTALTTLDLTNNSVSNLSPLAGLTKLTCLKLTDNERISNITPLAGLTSLDTLWLNGNRISDISSLTNLNSLNELNLRDNQIENISPLANMNSLTYLNLGQNNISEINALENLTNLTELHLLTNNITNVSSLSNLTNLEKLYMSENSISDISALASLTNLVELKLADNYLFSVDAIEGMTKLEVLDLRWNIISKIDPIVNNGGIGAGDTVWLAYALNPTNVEDEIDQLEARGVQVIWQPNNSTVCNKVSYVFNDINGDIVTVKLTGDGKAYLTFSENPGENNYVSLIAIDVTDSSNKTAISITVKKGSEVDSDGLTTLGDVTAPGLLKSITGKAVVLSGDVFLDTEETAGEKDSVTITLYRVEDAKIDTHTLPIKSLTTADWIDTDEKDDNDRDTITAPWISSINIKGGRTPDRQTINADFSADVILTGADSKGKSLGKFSAKGVVEMLVSAEDAILGTFSAGSWTYGGIDAGYVKSITTRADRKREGVVDGDILGEFVLSGTLNRKGVLESLGSLRAAGLVGGTFVAMGNTGALSASTFDSWAGMSLGYVKSITAKNNITNSNITVGTAGKISSKYDMGAAIIAMQVDAKGYSISSISAGGTFFGDIILDEGGLKSFKAAAAQGDILAKVVDSVNIKGGRTADKQTIDGDFTGDILVASANTKGVGLGKLSVKGEMTGNVITGTDDVATKTGQVVEIQSAVGTVTVGQWTEGEINAGLIKSITTRADKNRDGVDGDLGIDISTDPTNHDAFGKVTYAINTIKISGSITPPEGNTADWNIQGNTNSIAISGLADSLKLRTDNLKSFTAACIFESNLRVLNTLDNFNIKGQKIPRGEEPPAFAAYTHIQADTVNKASVVNWDIENPVTFEVPSPDNVKYLRYQDTRTATSQRWLWKPGNDWPTDAPTQNEVIITIL